MIDESMDRVTRNPPSLLIHPADVDTPDHEASRLMACSPHVPRYPPISTKPCSTTSDDNCDGGSPYGGESVSRLPVAAAAAADRAPVPKVAFGCQCRASCCCCSRRTFLSLRLQRVTPTKEAVGPEGAGPGGKG
jgi:hypothetical protein